MLNRSGVPLQSVFEFERRPAVVQTRPRRRAILVHKEAPIESTFELLGRMSSIWGGNYTIIVPTDGSLVEPVWLEHLRKFDPDVVGSALPSDALSERVHDLILRSSSPFRLVGNDPIVPDAMALGFSETPIKTILLTMPEPWVADVDLGSFPILGRVLFYERFGLVNPGLASSLKPQQGPSPILAAEDSMEVEVRHHTFDPNDEPLLDLLYMYFGKADHAPYTIARQVERGELRVEAAAEALRSTEVLRHLPLNLTRIGIEEVFDSRELPISELFQPSPVCVVGEKMPDYALAHNLRRMRRDVYWLPVRVPPNPDDGSILARLARAIASELAFEIRHEKAEVPVISMSVPERELTAFSDWLAYLGS